MELSHCEKRGRCTPLRDLLERARQLCGSRKFAQGISRGDPKRGSVSNGRRVFPGSGHGPGTAQDNKALGRMCGGRLLLRSGVLRGPSAIGGPAAASSGEIFESRTGYFFRPPFSPSFRPGGSILRGRESTPPANGTTCRRRRERPRW